MNTKKVIIGILSILVIYSIFMLVFTQYISIRPNIKNFELITIVKYDVSIERIGYRTISSMHQIMSTLMDKPGGYIANDIMPPFIWLDDMPNWETGALFVIRDAAIILRKNLTVPQTQASEDYDAVNAQTRFNVDSESWMFPSVEGWPWSTGQYREGIAFLKHLEERLLDDDENDANFYTRATSLANFIDMMNRILGSHSQRLSASVGPERVNIDTAGDRSAVEAKPQASVIKVKTPWLELDDIFWRAQGGAWAMSELFKAIRHDFRKVLEDKNAMPSMQQIIDELDAAQQVVWSPIILNGGGYGLWANHSLVLANYISRASASMSALKRQLEDG